MGDIENLENQQEEQENELNIDTKAECVTKEKLPKTNLCDIWGKRLMIIGITINFILAIILFVKINSLSNQVNLKVSDLQKQDLQIIARGNELNENVNKVNENIDNIQKRAWFNELNDGIASGGVVTDSIYTNKSFLYEAEEGGISGAIDIVPQPSLVLAFKGQGKIELEDTQIKNMLITMIKNIKDEPIIKTLEKQYNVKFDGGKIYFSHNNYIIGFYQNGQITLGDK